MKKAYEQSPAAVKKWLDEDYPVIAARAKAEGAEVHWGDESGLRSTRCARSRLRTQGADASHPGQQQAPRRCR